IQAQGELNRHVLSMKVTDPKGEDVRWYGAALEAKDGVAEGRIDFAFSDTPGNWKMQLTDTATGVSVGRVFNVILSGAKGGKGN
ncbi:MAG: hypothetical protein QF473_26445, partial [Planctomycetota bacterium]|nr:hypothetical protein [Planctomycetota bacterium]